MKHLKKLASLALALVMVMALAAPAFAANPYVPTKVNLTINATENNDLTVYQVFTGRPLKNDDGKFNQKFDDIAWGSSFDTWTKQTALITALRTAGALKTSDDIWVDGSSETDLQRPYSAEKVAQLLSVADTNEHKVEAERISKAVADVAAVEANGITGITMTPGQAKLLETGYYTVVDTLTQEDKDPVTIYSALNLVEDMQTDSKNKPDTVPDEPNVSKFVRTTGDGESWEKIDDMEKGGTVDFKIETVLNQEFQDAVDSQKRGDPNEDANFTLVFTDEQDPLLEVPTSVSVYYLKKGAAETDANLTPIPSSAYDFNTTDYGFTITMEAMERRDPYQNLQAGDKIILIYSTGLRDGVTAQQILDNKGAFKNEITLNYNKKEVSDDATAITFTLEIDKIDGGSGNYLEGAQFTLYKVNNGFQTGATGYEADDLTQVGQPIGATAQGNGNVVENLTDKAKFTFDGLKAGDYVLRETIVPHGYNQASDIYLKIVAEYEDVSGERVLKGYSVKQVNADGSAIANIPDITGTVVNIKDAGGEDTNVKAPDGALVKEVENNSGVLLPSTGGIGTTIFYIVGGVLLVGAVVLLIAKRRTSADEE